MTKKFIFLLLTLQVNYIFSQVVGFGVSFTPYDVEVSSHYKVEFETENEIALKKILDYFYPKENYKDSESFTTVDENNTVSTATKVTDEYVVIDGTFTFKFQDIKNLFVGFGRSEIIRLLLIKQKSDINPSLKDLVKDYKKLRSLYKLAQKYKLDYLTDVWLPSKEIYARLFEVKENAKKD